MRFSIPHFLGVFGCCLSAYADQIITPNTPTSTVAPNAGSTLAGLVDGAGLSAAVATGMDLAAALTVTHANDTLSQNYVTAQSGGDYFSAGTPPVFTFVLGGSYDNVNAIVLWNYAAGTGAPGVAPNNAAKNFDLQFFSDAAATVSLGSVTGLSLARSLPTTGSGSGPQVAQHILFTGGVDFDGVRAIRMTLTDNYAGFANGGGGDRVGLGEVRFAAIPEPSTYGLLGAASVALVSCVRRRRRGA